MIFCKIIFASNFRDVESELNFGSQSFATFAIQIKRDVCINEPAISKATEKSQKIFSFHPQDFTLVSTIFNSLQIFVICFTFKSAQ